MGTFSVALATSVCCAGALPVRVVETAFDARSPDLLKAMPGIELTKLSRPPGKEALLVDARSKYQEILGFGGSFTEAAAVNWRSMSAHDQAAIMHLYFGDPSEGGHGYTAGRVPMGSSDFSTSSYSFDDVPGDVALAHFDDGVSHDEANGMLSMIREAQRRVRARGHELRLLASPWSPPPWMKLPVNGHRDFNVSAAPNGLDPRYQRTWAKYFSRFVSAYRARGVDLWGVTVQNEPEAAPNWDACMMTAEFMAGFVKNHLGPVLREEHPGLKIVGYDHNKDHLLDFAKVLYADGITRAFVDGLAVHMYSGLGMDALNATHFLDSDKFLLPTEGSNCEGVVYRWDAVQWWSRAEAIALDILEDLRFWAVGWIDWNLALDTAGGPNHAGNLCDANIICDPNRTKGGDTIIKQASYFYMGHFSRFMPPGSRRVAVSTSVAPPEHPLTPGDVRNGQRLLFERCVEGAAPQRWHYNVGNGTITVWGAEAAEGSDGYRHGMCIDVVEGRCSVLQVWSCNGNPQQLWQLRRTPFGIQFFNAACGRCIAAVAANGDAVGLDAGVQVVAGRLERCAPGGAVAQAFNPGGADPSEAPAELAIAPVGGGQPKCLQPLVVRKPRFGSVAVQTPVGDVSLVALNAGGDTITFDLHDVASGLGAVGVAPPTAISGGSWRRSRLLRFGLQALAAFPLAPLRPVGLKLRPHSIVTYTWKPNEALGPARLVEGPRRSSRPRLASSIVDWWAAMLAASASLIAVSLLLRRARPGHALQDAGTYEQMTDA